MSRKILMDEKFQVKHTGLLPLQKKYLVMAALWASERPSHRGDRAGKMCSPDHLWQSIMP